MGLKRAGKREEELGWAEPLDGIAWACGSEGSTRWWTCWLESAADSGGVCSSRARQSGSIACENTSCATQSHRASHGCMAVRHWESGQYILLDANSAPVILPSGQNVEVEFWW